MRTISIIVFSVAGALILVSLLLEWIALGTAIPLLVGLMSLLGVVLTLEWNQRQFHANLIEERQKAEKKRRFEAKHVAFLRTAEAFSVAIGYLTSLVDRKLPADGKVDSELQQMAPALVALHFYCDYETIEAALKFGQTFAEATAAIIQAKVEPMLLIGEIESNAQTIDERHRRIERLEEEMILLLRADVNHPLLAHVRQALGELRQNLAALHQAQADLFDRKNAATERCREIAYERLPALHRCTNQLQLCARRELHFPIEEGKYADLLEQQTVAVSEYLQSFITTLRNRIHEQTEPSSKAPTQE
jgi:hypothetical protein